MSQKIENAKDAFPSELRMDLVSNDWVIIATGRAKRPESFAEESARNKEVVAKKDCPFCQEENIAERTAQFDNHDDWSVISIPNKYPALAEGTGKMEQSKHGPNRVMEGLGYHEVVIYRDHDRFLSQFDNMEMKAVIDMYQARYLDLISKEHIRYVSIFHNHGQEAGASVAHPHSQIFSYSGVGS